MANANISKNIQIARALRFELARRNSKKRDSLTIPSLDEVVARIAFIGVAIGEIRVSLFLINRYAVAGRN